MEFRILGPLEVRDERGPLAVGGYKPRALLAVLLLHANEVVAADQLVDALWGADAPESAGATLRLNISRLRKAIPSDVLVTRSPGYLLHVRPDDLDLYRFERLVDDGRMLLARGSPVDASERLGEALALWRGRPLADFVDDRFAFSAIVRLEEIRLAAVELRIDIDLAIGRHSELVGQLRSLVAEHPFHEHFRGCLMTALYRSGRQAEALGAYQDARRVLVDELGIEPSKELLELERAILRQDCALDLPANAQLTVRQDHERSVLVAVTDENHISALLSVAELLLRDPPRAMVLARAVADATTLGNATTRFEALRAQLQAKGVAARAATFTSITPGADLARLAAELDSDLLLTDASGGLLTEGSPDIQLDRILAETTCDVAVLVSRDEETTKRGPVLVPFGGSDNDWSAVDFGARLARAWGVPLRLAGVVAVPERHRRDASRLLSHACVAVQRVLGVPAEPMLVEAGPEGILDAGRSAGMLVVGMSSRWRDEGLGPVRLVLARRAHPPTVFVRRGLRPGGLAPPAALTRFTWSI